MPLIRAAVQIVACGSGVIAVCVGVSGALELVAGGSIEDAIKAMAFTVGSMVAWSGVGFVTDYLRGAMGVADKVLDAAAFGFAAAKGAIHGVVGGALSLAQGGNFGEGFIANAAGAFAGVMSEGVFGPARTGGLQGFVGRVTSAGVAAGTASELVGGKFSNGAVSGAFAQMWNGEGIHTWLAKEFLGYVIGQNQAESYWVRRRAISIQEALLPDEYAYNSRTVAVMLVRDSLGNEEYLAATSGNGINFTASQRAELDPYTEREIKGQVGNPPSSIAYHAEIKLYEYAHLNYLTPLALGTSRPACPACMAYLQTRGMIQAP